MKKRIFALGLSLVLAFSVTACGKEEVSSKKSNSDSGTKAVSDKSGKATSAKAFGKNLGISELEEIVKNLKATDYEGGKKYLEAAFEDFLFDPRSNIDIFNELIDHSAASNYPTNEVKSFSTGKPYFSVNFHYTDKKDNVPLLFGRELSSVGYGEEASGIAFSYSFSQYSEAIGNTGNLYGKKYVDRNGENMTDIYESPYGSKAGKYDGTDLRKMISADNCYEVISALIDAYGEPKATDNAMDWNVGDTITKDKLKTIIEKYTHFSCCWKDTSVGKIDVVGFFGDNSSVVILTVEW